MFNSAIPTIGQIQTNNNPLYATNGQQGQKQYPIAASTQPATTPGNSGTSTAASPVAASVGLGGATGTGTGTGTGYSPAYIAYFQNQADQLARQQQSAQTALQQGLTGIGDQYNQQLNQANTNQSNAIQDLEMQRENTTDDKNTALGQINNDAMTLANSLRNKIGMEGGADSSAYQLAAPEAVARNSSIQRTGVQQNYGENFRNLDVTQNRDNQSYQTLLQSLLGQKNQQSSDFSNSMLNEMNQIDQSLATLAFQKQLVSGGGEASTNAAMQPYEQDMSTRQNAIDSLFNQYRTPWTVTPVNYATPTLLDYTAQTPTIASNTPTDTSTNDYSTLLQKKLDDNSAATSGALSS
jgi:hypothetical protein